ncbi:MAG: nickel pincer cofactor biosynthesis protein LarC [Desulfosalsimonas sp.]
MIAYFDCFSGISGDMTLGALIDLGVPAQWLKKTIAEKLPLEGFDIRAETVECSGISAMSVSVTAEDGTERDYAEISGLIKSSALPGSVIKTSLAMFDRLAEAEAAIHGCEKDHVHFHEVGGVDAIVDMVGTALAVDYLGIDEVTASALPMGSGHVECSHGKLPVPAPATAQLLKGVPVYGSEICSELVTPTGAAIITTLAQDFGAIPDMIMGAAGYGAGSRRFESRPNVLRVLTGSSNESGDSMMLVETCIDDMNPEIYGYLTDRLFAGGARDVYMIPVYMKKGRPGTMLQVLCEKSRREDLASMILTETSAIGVRYYPVSRQVLERSEITVETPYGRVSAKQVYTPDGGARITPEYESCRQVAEKNGIALQAVYRAAGCAAHETDWQKS